MTLSWQTFLIGITTSVQDRSLYPSALPAELDPLQEGVLSGSYGTLRRLPDVSQLQNVHITSQQGP